jgi:hypothetical protein
MATRRFNLRNRAAFTASIEEQLLAVRPGTYIDGFTIEFSGDLAAMSTVAIETFLNLLNPWQFKVNGDVRHSIRGRDLFALNALYLGKTPGGFEGAAGEDDKIYGMKAPVWYTVQPNDSLSWLATRVAVTNVSGEDISIAYTTMEGVRRAGPYHIVELTGTSPGTTGVARAVDFLPRVGLLQGLLWFSTTVPTATADTTTLDEIRLYRNDVLDVVATWQDLAGDARFTGNLITASAFVDALANYRWLDLSEDPWNTVNDRVAIDVDFGVASEAYRIIPVYLMPGQAGAGAPAAR